MPKWNRDPEESQATAAAKIIPPPSSQPDAAPSAEPVKPAPLPVVTYLHKSCRTRTAVSEDHPKQANGAWCGGCRNYFGLDTFDFG